MKNRELRRERIEQLREGIEAAAAALPPEFSPVGSETGEAGKRLADRLVELERAFRAASGEEASVERVTETPAGPRLAENVDPSDTERQIEAGISLLEELHYHLVRVTVLGDSPDELGIPGEVNAALGLAEEAGQLLRT